MQVREGEIVLNVAEAAVVMDVDEDAVRRLCEAGVIIVADREAGDWKIPAAVVVDVDYGRLLTR